MNFAVLLLFPWNLISAPHSCILVRRHAVGLPELTDEVGYVRVPNGVTDFRYGGTAFQENSRIIETPLCQIGVRSILSAVAE